MKVIAEIDKCIGAGQCVRAAGDVFTQDDDTGLVEVLVEHPDDSRRAAVETAVRLCPTHALKLED
ncbi:ferredoxin [Microbacterium sp.]|uniref:ferredoxin n=1 Tax=Microbacterium sp. TaxID=51671 RepID=UPI0039E55391